MHFLALSWVVLAFYTGTAVLYWWAFVEKDNRILKRARNAYGVVILLHFITIVHFSLYFSRVPIATVGESFGTMVFLTATIYWVLEWRLKEASMGILLLPIFVLLMLIGNLTFTPSETISPILKDIKFEIHVITMLLGYGAFALAAIASLLYKLLDREIRSRRMGMFYSRLPSLPFFLNISNAAIDTGIIFTTVGLGLGIYLAVQVWGTHVIGEPKFFSALLTWCLYGIHVIGRRKWNFNGQRATSLALIGFGWLLFSYLVISLLFTRVHHFA
jgi:ABC-type uncharacterized transport system permease subunit